MVQCRGSPGWTCVVWICVVCALWVACVCEGSQDEDNYSVRATNYGKLKGRIEHVHAHKEVEKFFGVPYASPPVGKLRLEAPEPPLPWGDSILDATELPPACPQTTEGVVNVEFHVPGFNRTSEDCLYLNIYVPRGRHASRSMPVLVFIHGGSYLNGMGAMFDGSALSAHGIVVVTFNYRLGPLGFMTSVDDVIPGNYGMLDMVQALKWVQGNIAYFNGDASRVTIDGHSAGGCSVGLLLLSPLAKGLFHQVIQQSGSPLAQWSVARHQRRPNFIYNVFAKAVNCLSNSSLELKRCMQALDSKTLENVILEQFEWSVSLTPQYRPVIDGHFLPRAPEDLVKTAPLNAHRFMTGATKDEGLVAAIPLVKLFGVGKTGVKRLLSLMRCFRGDLPEVTGIVDTVLTRYVELKSSDISESEIESSFSEIVGDYFITAPTHLMAEELSKRNVSVYLYNYEYMSLLDQIKGTIHGAEIFYLSGCPFTGHKNFRYDEPDRNMAKLLILLWANFIKYGYVHVVQALNMAKLLILLWANFIKYGFVQFPVKRESVVSLTGHKNFRYDEPDRKMAKLLILLWANFIKYGAPSLHPREEMSLPRYTPNTKLYTRIYSKLEPTITISSHYKPGRMRFWNQEVPDMYRRQTEQRRREINVSYQTDVFTNEYLASYKPDKQTWILTSVCICLSVLTLVLTVAYYKMRRDVTRMGRQNGGHPSGERMLPTIL